MLLQLDEWHEKMLPMPHCQDYGQIRHHTLVNIRWFDLKTVRVPNKAKVLRCRDSDDFLHPTRAGDFPPRQHQKELVNPVVLLRVGGIMPSRDSIRRILCDGRRSGLAAVDDESSWQQ